MSLEKTAQELFIVDQGPSIYSEEPHMEQPIEVSMDEAEPVEVSNAPIEVSDNGESDIVISLSDIPGAPPGTPDPEPELEVSEEVKEEKKDDENDAKSKKNEKWDWAKRGPTGFVVWIKERFDDVPKHSGFDSAGVERAASYLERLDNEISKAMRLDLDGELDADKIEEIRSKIEDGINRLHDRLTKIKKSKKPAKKRADYIQEGIVKEAQKITGVQGIFVTVDLFISAIGRAMINGMVSSGKDIESLFSAACDKYKLDDREKLSLTQFLFDLGYPMMLDRGNVLDEDFNWDKSEWIQQFKS
jgi:ElaB/YqjD/DUF883 family membrane-anchored ribosome-binding protein